jgi:hypothetical protein
MEFIKKKTSKSDEKEDLHLQMTETSIYIVCTLRPLHQINTNL